MIFTWMIVLDHIFMFNIEATTMENGEQSKLYWMHIQQLALSCDQALYMVPEIFQILPQVRSRQLWDHTLRFL